MHAQRSDAVTNWRTVPFGTAVRGLPAFCCQDGSLETRHCESRPARMHGAKRPVRTPAAHPFFQFYVFTKAR